MWAWKQPSLIESVIAQRVEKGNRRYKGSKNLMKEILEGTETMRDGRDPK